jgi:hypothetical protein
VQGQVVTINVNAVSREQITGGNYDMKILFMGIQVDEQKGTLASLGAPLPIAPGPFTVKVTQNVPSLPIHGPVTIVWSATDQSGAPLVCVSINTNIMAGVPSVIPPLRQNVPFTNCGSSSDQATLNNVQATPWPPQQGQSLTVEIDGTSKEVVSSGNYDAKVYFLGIEVEDKTGTLASLGVTLPIPVGAFSFKKTHDIPNLPIHGQVQLVLSATDQNGNELVCASITTTI